MKKKFIVPRHNWVCGAGLAETCLRTDRQAVERAASYNKQRKQAGEPPMKVPRIGQMCIMGHVGAQVGIPKERLNSKATLMDIDVTDLAPDIRAAVESLERFDCVAYEFNDQNATREVIEQELIELFERNGYKLEFV